MCGMQRNQVKFATLDAGNDFRLRKIRLDFSLTNVAPPDQHVGPIEIFLGQPLFRIVEVAGEAIDNSGSAAGV